MNRNGETQEMCAHRDKFNKIDFMKQKLKSWALYFSKKMTGEQKW